jgi:hypothetical protein
MKMQNLFNSLGNHHLIRGIFESLIFQLKLYLKNYSLKTVLACCLLFSNFNVFSNQETIDCGELSEVIIECRRINAFTANINFGIISFTYTKYKLICNNGYESSWDEFWS